MKRKQTAEQPAAKGQHLIRLVDPHRIVEDETARRGTTAPNTPILCCECGSEYLRATWEGTVAAFRAHEGACRKRRNAPANP
jgi:hypothetical protein